MDKQERILNTISGEQTDRPPVFLWRRWPGDDQRAADLARSIIDFQKTHNWDLVNIVPSDSFCVTDYGVQDEWEGDQAGWRTYTRRAVYRSIDWTELRPLDPLRGALGRQLECAQLVTEGLRNEVVPIVHMIHSPLAQAQNIAGNDLLIRHIRTSADRVHTGLNTITESTLRFIDSLKRLPIAGIIYVVRHASYDLLTEEEYQTFGLAYDRKILELLPEKWWLSILHLDCEAPMLRLCSQLPIQVVNWHDQETEPDLAQGRLLFRGALCGGLSSRRHLHLGTPSAVREQIRTALNQVNHRRLIISTGGAMFVTTPLSNIRAARESVGN
jgi:uroporphyrinogen decarboxylase